MTQTDEPKRITGRRDYYCGSDADELIGHLQGHSWSEMAGGIDSFVISEIHYRLRLLDQVARITKAAGGPDILAYER